jgi:hypothetical protein
MKKTMKKSDWVILRLLRKIVLSPDRSWVRDVEIRKAFQYLIDKYGDKLLDKCIDALAYEEKQLRQKQEEYLFTPPVPPEKSEFVPPKSLNKVKHK